MSKSAIHAMTMSLATEWGRYGIRLNTIAPGEIPTEGMSKRIKPGDEAGAIRSRGCARAAPNAALNSGPRIAPLPPVARPHGHPLP